MTDFFNLDTGGAETTTESVGGGFSLPETGVYPYKVVQAFADKYASGSKFVSVTLMLDGKMEHTERFLISNKDGKSYFTDKNGKNVEYPGVTRFNELVDAAGLDKTKLAIGPGKIKAWDSSAKAFTLQAAEQVLHALKDTEGLVAIEKVSENKQAKGDNGYYKTNDRVEAAYVRKFAASDKKTMIEKAKNIDPVFMDAWKEKHAGKTADLFKNQSNAPQVGQPPAIGGSTTDLFE